MKPIQIDITLGFNCVNKGNAATIQWKIGKDITIEQLNHHLTVKGYPASVGVFSGSPAPIRRKEHFLYSQLIGFDFDDLTVELADELLSHPLVTQYAAFTYSTPSHSPTKPRLRVFFVLERPINGAERYENAVRRIMYALRHLKPDKACKDAARFFYGNNQPDPAYTLLLGNILPIDVLSALPEEQTTNQEINQAQSFDELPTEFIADITAAIRFTDKTKGEFLECHCPIHPPDKEPSAHWHPEKHILYCFHDGKTYLAKQVGDALGIRLEDYVPQRHTTLDVRRPEFNQATDTHEPLELDAKFPEFDADTVALYVAMNEYGDALLLMLVVSYRIIFDHSEKVWYWWLGHVWCKDELYKTSELIYAPVGELYTNVARELTNRLAKLEADPNATDEAKDKLKAVKAEIDKRPRALRSYHRANNVMRIATTLSGLAGNEWDSNPMLLGVPNGVIDLTTGTLRPGKKSDYIRKVTNIDYASKAQAPRWNQFMPEIVDGDIEIAAFIQRLFGYFITGQMTDHILPVFYGRGRNGKDTMVEVIGHVLGDYASSGTSDLLIEQSNFQGQAQPHIYNLMGKRLVWITETSEGSRLNVNQVKYLTGAGRISARPLYGNPIEFDATHHIVLFTNHKPRVPSESEDYAIWKRLLLIPLTLSFVDNPTAPHERQRDPDLKHKLLQESQGILNWLIKGCLEWQKQGLNPPDAIRNATSEYARSEDIIGIFLEEMCEFHDLAEVGAGDLLQAYNMWAIQNGYPEVSARKFSDRLKQQFDKKRAAKGMVYIGLSLRKM